MDTKGSHADLTADYAAVPAEMKAVARAFEKDVLAEVDERQFLRRFLSCGKSAATGRCANSVRE